MSAARTEVPAQEIPAQDRLAVRALAEVYATAVDHADADLYATIWAPQAVQRVFRKGRDDLVLRMPDQRDQIITGLARYAQTLHLVMNQWCVPSGPEVIRAEVYCEAHHLRTLEGAGTVDDRVMHIRYEDEYRRLPQGWRVAVRDVHVLWLEDRKVLPGDRR